MSLQKIVNGLKFKKLAKQLTDNEFNKFISNLSNIFNDRDLILNVLCGKFATPSNQVKIITKMNEIISKIIQNRKNNIRKTKATKLDQLPSAIIGEIASYLDQREYAKFSRSNSTIFIATNSPNNLKTLKFRNIKRDMFIRDGIPKILAKCKKVENLSFYKTDVTPKITENSENVLPNLVNLSVIGSDVNIEILKHFGPQLAQLHIGYINNSDILDPNQLKQINFTKLEKLHFNLSVNQFDDALIDAAPNVKEIGLSIMLNN